MEHKTRLVAYAPNGAKLGPLPWPLEFSATVPTGELGAASLTYSRAAVGGGLLQRTLTQGLEVALEEWDGAAWVEPRGGRFIAIERSFDPSDRTDTVSLTCPAYGWVLAKVKHAAPSEALYSSAEGENQGRRQFLGVNAGTVIKTLRDEYVDRGGYAIELGFTTAADSNGNPWPSLNAFWISRGEALDVTLARLYDGGAVDWWWQGRTLHMAPPSAGRERGSVVILRAGREIAEAASTETIADLISAQTLHGGDGVLVTTTEPTAPTPWGRWEGFASDDRVTLAASATARNQQVLAEAGRLRGQYTRDLTPLNPHRLGIDILPGDWIAATTTSTASTERVRVASLLWRASSSGVTRSLILNDTLLDRELRRQRRERIGSDAGSNGSGTTVRPTSELDSRQPAAPTGLAVTSDAILVQGVALGVVSAAWNPVTTATDSTAMEIARYELWGRLNVAGSPWRRCATTDGTSTDATWFDPGSEWLFKVRAIGQYSPVAGVFSAQVPVLIESDVTPPAVPSAPTLRTKLGVIMVDWNGKTNLDASMEPDFVHVEVGMATTSAPGDLSPVDTLEGKGMAMVVGQPYDALRWFALRSVDRSGNKSAWSTSASIATTALVDVEAIVQKIDEASIQINTSGQTLSQKLALIQSAADASQITTSTAVASGTKLAGHLWWQVDGTGKVIGQWTQTASPSGSTWVSRPITSEVIANLDVGKLTASTALFDTAVIDKLWADVIRARKVTADMLLVGAGANLLPWEPWSTTAPHATANGSSLTVYNDSDYGRSIYVNNGVVPSGTFTTTARLMSGTTAADGYFGDFTAAAGEVYRFRVGASVIGSYTNGAPQVRLLVTAADKDGVYVPGSQVEGVPISPATSGAPTFAELAYTVPAAATAIRLSVQQDQPGPVILFAAALHRMSDASLIVDGGILTRHIGALQVDAGKIAANAITADKINAGTLDAFVITGGNIRTSAANPRNLLNSSGLSAYDGSGTLQARLGNMTSASGQWGVEARDPLTGTMAPLASTLYGTRAATSTAEAGSVSIDQPVDTGWLAGGAPLSVSVILPTGRARVEVSGLLRYGDDTPTLCKGGNYWLGVRIKQGTTEITAPSTFYAAQAKFPASGVLGLMWITASWVVTLDGSSTGYEFTQNYRAQTWAGTGNQIKASLLARNIIVTPL